MLEALLVTLNAKYERHYLKVFQELCPRVGRAERVRARRRRDRSASLEH